MNDYKKQFEESMSQEHKDYWQSFFEDTIDWKVNLQQEYKGIDAFIKEIPVQFKMRETWYNDFLFEMTNTNGEKGWINKHDQQCIYMIAGCLTNDFILIWNWQKLQEIWEKERFELVEKYKKNIRLAPNPKDNRHTINLAVPYKEVGGALTQKKIKYEQR